MPAIVTDNAEGLLTSGISGGATSFTLNSGQGAKFPSPGTGQYFYARLGTDASNEVVKCTARSSDTITCVATAGAWDAGTYVMLGPCQALYDDLPKIILADTTLTVRSSGGDYTSLASALAALKNVLIAPDATVTVEVDDGAWTQSAVIKNAALNADRVIIKGRNTYSVTVNSVQSSSGSAGAWSIILNVSSISNIAVNDYILIGSVSGGTTPDRLSGCWKITNVDSGNTRITVASTNRSGAAPSGSVTGSATIIKTIIDFTAGTNGFQANTSLRNVVGYGLQNLVVRGNGTSSTYGLYMPARGIMGIVGNVGIVGFDRGIFVQNGSDFYASGSVWCCSNSSHGWYAANDAQMRADTALISTGNGGTGASLFVGSTASTPLVIINGNGGYGVDNERRGLVNFAAGVITDNTTYDAYASNGGYNYIVGVTATNLSPVANTLGNENGYNDTA